MDELWVLAYDRNSRYIDGLPHFWRERETESILHMFSTSMAFVCYVLYRQV